jgi:general secretion pathway protein M
MAKFSSQYWSSLGGREKRLVVGMGSVVLAAIVYLLCFEPAWQGRKKLATELPQLRAEVAQVDALNAEIRRTAASASATGVLRGLRDEVEKSLARAGMKAATLTGSDDGVDVRLAGIGFDQLLLWQQAVQKDLRLRTTKVTVARDSKAGLVTAQLLLEPAVKAGGR